MDEIGYIKALGIHYPGALSKIKKSDDLLQPIYEAFTNSLEAISILKSRFDVKMKGEIAISIYLKKNVFSHQTKDYDFDSIVISDNGVGFDGKEFERLVALSNDEKGFSNRGTGRVQYLHSFDKTIVVSYFRNETSKTGFSVRKLTLSKSEPFLKNKAIIHQDEGNLEDFETYSSGTLLKFLSPLIEKDKKYFEKLSVQELKSKLLNHYLAYFCEHKNELPLIKLNKYIDSDLDDSETIVEEDIPVPDYEQPLEVNYTEQIDGDLVQSEEVETFILKSFKLPDSDLEKNALILVSKGELANPIKLNHLQAKEDIEGNRYLFLLSGKYIDDRDSDNRGRINFLKKSDFKRNDEPELFDYKVIILEDLENAANKEILNIYEEIKQLKESQHDNIDKLKKMFLLNPDLVDAIKNKINLNDSDDVILRKVYEAEAKTLARGDAYLKQQIEDLKELDTSSDTYGEDLEKKVEEFVKSVPLQNRTALTHYVARRKLVLELFGKIIDKKLNVQNKKTKQLDEKLLHNLIFQQGSENPESSDLWLLNEEYIYFKGTSEGLLRTINLDEKGILKEDLTVEEEEYKLKQQGDASLKRPDILLFPKEGKCIILEFKSLDVNVSLHLNQINRYASLINNLSKDSFNFHTYYGYLIGENIDVDDIQDNDSDFKSSPKLDYIFRPHKRILGKFGKDDGALYTEVIKYSTILDRAEVRNRIFIDKLSKIR